MTREYSTSVRFCKVTTCRRSPRSTRNGAAREILEAAQRVSARHGYEGATVARLEAETDLSRGAIFSYFPSKDALFVAVIGRSSGRLVELWLERGFRALLDEIANEDLPGWRAVHGDAAGADRRALPKGGRGLKAQGGRPPAGKVRAAARHGSRRSPIEAIARFLSALANGLALARVSGDELGDLDTLFELSATAWRRAARPRGARRHTLELVDPLQLLHTLDVVTRLRELDAPHPRARQRSAFV